MKNLEHLVVGFVDTIGDPGVDELEQVETPATGQPAQNSEFFGIAQVTTIYSM